jgi:membrane-associated phospholipid phosphatase
MSSYDPLPEPADAAGAHRVSGSLRARVGTVVWGLIVLALAALIIISRLGLVALNGTYVLIGLMIGAGAALVIGGLLSARRRDNDTTTRKS